MVTWRTVAIAIAVMLVAAGCGEDGDAVAEVSPSPDLGFTRADVCNAIVRGGEGLSDLPGRSVGYTYDEASDAVLEYAATC